MFCWLYKLNDDDDDDDDDVAQRLREEEKRQQEEYDRQRVAQSRAVELLTREQDRRRRDINDQLAVENRRLASEQKGHQHYMDNDVYTNVPTAAYFMQWNTSTR